MTHSEEVRASVAAGSHGRGPAASPSLDYAVRIRKQLNLRHDLAYISELEKQPGLDFDELATPITDDELADLRKRHVITSYVHVVGKRLSGDANYAGIWFDQIPGGGVRIALTGEPTREQVKDVTGLLPPGAKVTYQDVKYTRLDLQSLLDMIVAVSAFVPAAGKLSFRGASVDGVNNLVDVQFADAHDAAAFVEHFGADPRIKTRVRPRHRNPNPAYG